MVNPNAADPPGYLPLITILLSQENTRIEAMSSIAIPLNVVTDIENFPIPERKTTGSAGADLQAAIREAMVIEPGESALVASGIAIALPEGYEAQIRPRSGLALKNQISVLNSPGTIDSDYRGEIGVILINHGNSPFTIDPLMRIAQMVIAEVPNTMWVLSDDLDDTERGAGGFGHTGH